MKEDFPTFEGINTFTAKTCTCTCIVTDRIRQQCTQIQNSHQLMSGGEAKNSPAVGSVQRRFNLSLDVGSLFHAQSFFAVKQTTSHTSLLKICTYWYIFFLFNSHLVICLLRMGRRQANSLDLSIQMSSMHFYEEHDFELVLSLKVFFGCVPPRFSNTDFRTLTHTHAWHFKNHPSLFC